MKKGDVAFLKQLIESLAEAQENLRQAYATNDTEQFNKSKRFMLQIQRKISQVLK